MDNLNDIIELFDIKGSVESIIPYGCGYINKTYLVTTSEDTYILQNINNFVFKDVEGLMNNINLVTSFLKSKNQETLDIIPLKNGELFLNQSVPYRLYKYIDNTITYNSIINKEAFYNSGKAFGEFQKLLSDFDSTSLVETIPNFHNTIDRYNKFIEQVNLDAYNRKKDCQSEIDYVISQKDNISLIIDGLNDGSIPLRVTHNDTKINNILFDSITNKSRAIIDLDTIMPGSLLYDYGDSIRSGCNTASEDEKDLNKVNFNYELFIAYTKGFLEGAKDMIKEREKSLLVYSAYLMCLECGMRFLTDYLNNDQYFKTTFDKQNLYRARTQLKLASQIKDNSLELNKIINELN